jgi:23S rRNA (cytosine1962-C5)-methyltransferase
MQNLPEIKPQRLAVKLRPAAEKAVRQAHPWVFESGIAKVSKEGKGGDLAIIFDQKKNKFLALGLYDPHSPIRVKILVSGQSATLNEAWFEEKITVAYDKRKPLLATDTNSYRLIYGENDGLPGFIADVYDNVLVVKLYSAIWLPYLAMIFPPLLKVTNCETLVLRLSRLLQNLPKEMHGLEEGQVLHGTLKNEEVIFREHGLSFSANVIHGHKTGYFLDHRHNRKRVGELSEGKTILDIFAYAGGFSVHALAGGAKEVTSLDISAQALGMAEKNVALNDLKANHNTMAVDAFVGLAELAQEGKKFDLIILDPPSFAKRESERERAMESYSRLIKAALPILSKGGILLSCSCSSRVKAEEFFAINERILEQSGKQFEELDRTFHDVDHPIGFVEGAYLKSVYYRVG